MGAAYFSRGIPYVGRIHDVPSKGTWIKIYEWSKKYGPIFQMKIFGTIHVWISSERVAVDLLSKRSNIYSDRPMIPNLPNNRTSGEYLALLGRTDVWQRQRKLCNHLMHASAANSLHAYPARERDRFLYLMQQDPDAYIEWIEQFTSRTVSRLCWGTTRPSQILRYTTFGLLKTISPSGALPNILNFLRHLPARVSPWKKRERERHVLEEKMLRANTKKSRDERERKRWGELEEAMRVVGLMAIAGALTIGSPIQSYLLAMCHFPEWQTAVQDEIDRELGGRCPQWEDNENLPLLRAVVKEVIRWRPPVPTGIPHAVEQNDIYDGFFVPGGSTVHALEWGITRDPEKYPDPEAFNPARWVDPEYPSYRDPIERYPNLGGFSQFGFGRRTCQGVPVVEQDLFLVMGGMAWAFDVRKKRVSSGKRARVHWNNYTPLLIAKPSAFPFHAAVRSSEKAAEMRWMFKTGREEPEREGDMDIGQFETDLGDLVYADDRADREKMVDTPRNAREDGE
ncbi:hypothetical protein N0V88_006844 [Collariella sp. IMI 366227]|nr:hypothetical protein N0V88_006844 [Collariella sp. IMI 366227]